MQAAVELSRSASICAERLRSGWFASLSAMDETTPGTDVLTAADHTAEVTESTDLLIEEELLVEEISIDGMCGVY